MALIAYTRPAATDVHCTGIPVASAVSPQAVRDVRDHCNEIAGQLPEALLTAYGFAFRLLRGQVEPCAVFAFEQLNEQVHNAVASLPRSIAGMRVQIERAAPSEQTTGWLPRKAEGGVGIRLKGDDHLPANRRGTLGCIVLRQGQEYALTCEHVLTDGAGPAKIGSNVLWQQGRGEKSDWSDLGRIALVNPVDPVNSAGSGDSALVSLECLHVPKVRGIGRIGAEPIDENLAVALQLPVVKSGASTGVTYGRVRGMFSIKVNERDAAGAVVRKVLYRNALEVMPEDWRTPFCRAADSGAVFWENDGRYPRPVGLLCSTSGVIKAYAVPMSRVLQDCGAQVIGR